MLHKAKAKNSDDGKQRKMKVFGPKEKKAPSFPELHISGAVQSSNLEGVQTLAQKGVFCNSAIDFFLNLAFQRK